MQRWWGAGRVFATSLWGGTVVESTDSEICGWK